MKELGNYLENLRCVILNNVMLSELLAKLKTARDCWALGFQQCPGEMDHCHVHLSLVQWIRIARGSRISDPIAEECADKGNAIIQIFCEDWEQDIAQIVHFHIHDDWPPDMLVVQSFQLTSDGASNHWDRNNSEAH